MKKRILAMLLAVVMLVGSLPISTFATETTEPTITPCETEGCEYASGHEGDCSNYVAPTEPCTSEGCTYGANHEGNCSNHIAPTACETEGCTYAYSHEGDCSPVVDQAAAQNVIGLIAAIGEVTLESEAAIAAADAAYNNLTDAQKVLVTNLDALETAKAAYMELTTVPEPAEAATPVDVYLTISSSGVLQLVNGKVTVTDINSDGVLTYEEALIAGHKAHCPAGEDGYEAQESTYGSFVVKLWGIENGGSAYFYMNDRALAYGVSNTENSTVASSDRLYAANIVDTASYSDTYTYFTQQSTSAEAGTEITLTLKCEDGTAASGVTIGTWSNKSFTALDGKTTDDNGQVTLSFAEAGTYYISASGTVAGTDWSGNPVECPIVPPVCVVTVEETEEPATGLSKLQFTSGSKDTSTVYTLSPSFDSTVKEYTLIVPDSTASIYAWATLADGVSDTITVDYSNTSGISKTVTLTSGKTSGTSISSAVKSGAFDGNTMTVTVGDVVYTVNIQRQATLSKLAITLADGSAITLSPAFSATTAAYTAKIPYDAVLTVAPTVKTTGAAVVVSGTAEDGTVIPAWEDLSSEVIITVSGEGAVSSTYTVTLQPLATEIEILTPPDKTTYTAGETFDPTGMTLKATYGDGSTETIGTDAFTYAPNGALAPSVTEIEVSFDGLTVKQPITIPAVFEGAGTQEDPYLIKTTTDLVRLSDMVSGGLPFTGEYFQMTADITLPDNWTPLGVDAKVPFSGNFDGGNHLLTVPEGGLPLIGTPKGAKLSNLNVYGSKIAGYGVVNNYCEIGKTHAITIENVTLKSGTQTLQSGFIGGYASGSDTVTIRNCTVEQGVVIGYDKSQKWVGSFAGEFNGTIETCVSYATVYGTDFVGGIVSNKGQSMGTFTVSNCYFHGDVIATGNYVGGIVGHGYGGTKWGFSNNAGIPTITNCTATGSVSGANYVGGIYGGDVGVVQVWDNAAGSVTGNSFTGTVSATGGEYVGAIIGYLKSLNKNNVIENNTYSASCGAAKGIGYMQYVDTSCETHETSSGATYFNTAEGKPGITGVTKTNLNRTDDPLGADATMLSYAKVDPAEITVTIANQGELVMTRKTVTVTDYDKDGSLDVDDALYAAHEVGYRGGAAAGYSCYTGDYGLSLGKLWGDTSGCYGYYLNDASCWSLADAVKTGDNLVAFVYKDQTYWSDAYARFGSDSYTATAGEALTVTVEIGGWTADYSAYEFTAMEGAVISCSTANVCTVDGYNLTFSQPGTYYITAAGSEGAILVPPVAVVTVEEPVVVVPKETLSALKFTSGSSTTATTYTMTPAFDPKVTEYTLVVPDSSSSIYAWATLGGESTGTIQVTYTNTSAAAASVTLTSGKTTGTSLSKAIASGKLTGSTLTIMIGDEAVYTVNIVRQATLSKLVVMAGEDTVTLSPTFNATKFAYTADIAYDAVLTVTPTVKSPGSTVTINGSSETTVTPVWSDRTSELIIKVSGGEGTVESTYTIQLAQLATKIEILTPPDKTIYTAGETFDPTGMTLKATYSDGYTETITKDAYTYAPTTALTPSVSEIEVSFDGLIVKQPITIPAVFEGSGTQTDPYKIKTTEDLVRLSELVAGGVSFSGEYLEMVNDITLPDAEGDDAWVPIGVSKKYPFSGNFDGGGHLLTVPEGGLPLIGFPTGASLCNLNIYGSKIAGFGVVNNYAVGATITIDKVTLKSGTQTLKSGFIGGYASGSNAVTITNCVVELGVVIGYDKQQEKIGSFAGDYNGTIDNCVSYATVYGTDFVGGIAGCKGQTMGNFAVTNCKFYGTVIATGNYVGGIVGHGYGGTQWGISSAPNAPCITIQNCECSGSVTGGNYVGGVLGAESGVAQCWENGIGYIQNNRFTGTVSATSGSYVGGIIGYMRSLNKYNEISNNYYSASCGAAKGIGGVQYVDTNCATHETGSGTTYFNTENGTLECPSVTYCSWKKEHNRTDDPLGADAAKLCYTDTQTDPIAVELKVSGTYKTEYITGDELDLSGIVLTVVYNDESQKTINLNDATITGYDASKVGEQKLTISYNSLTAFITVKVENPTSEIKVTVSILGDSEHGDNGSVHTLSGGSLTTWVSAKTYTVGSNSTVWDVLKKCLDEMGYAYSNPTGNYITSIRGLAEFDNGTNSGWMYTLNGAHPENGVAQQYLKDGDKIVLHYTDDYTKEEGSSGSDENKDAEAAEKVEKLIDAIGTVTLDSKSKINAARAAYDDLTYTQKQLVDNYAKLTAAESKYTELKAADDEKKAEAVEDLIDGIKEGSTTFEDDVKAAQKAYNNLTADQKKLVDNYYKLVNYLKTLADEEDKEAAEAVDKLIDAIGTVTKDSEDEIKAARDAYDKLTDEQKALVGNLAVLEAAEEKLAELKALVGIEDIYKTTGDCLEKLGTPVPGSVGGEWMVIGLIRSGREIVNVDAYYDAVVKYVQENIDENERLHQAKSTENSRMILALTAIGKDVTNVDGHNLLAGLNDMAYIQKQGINGPIWALIAFDSGNYPVPEGDVSREALIQVILDAQLPDGGWALSGSTSDADITGMALQALAPYYKTDANVKAAVEVAIETLSMMQASDGSFGSIDGISSESIAQVIAALSALGIDAHTDARFVKNGVSALDALCAFYVQGGGFKHIPSGKLDGMATEQSYYALAAYFRMLDKQTALYDMTDVIDMGGDVAAEKDVETLPAESEPAPTEPVEPSDEGGRSFPWWLAIVIVVLAGTIVALVIVSKPKKRSRVR